MFFVYYSYEEMHIDFGHVFFQIESFLKQKIEEVIRFL